MLCGYETLMWPVQRFEACSDHQEVEHSDARQGFADSVRLFGCWRRQPLLESSHLLTSKQYGARLLCFSRLDYVNSLKTRRTPLSSLIIVRVRISGCCATKRFTCNPDETGFVSIQDSDQKTGLTTAQMPLVSHALCRCIAFTV